MRAAPGPRELRCSLRSFSRPTLQGPPPPRLELVAGDWEGRKTKFCTRLDSVRLGFVCRGGELARTRAGRGKRARRPLEVRACACFRLCSHVRPWGDGQKQTRSFSPVNFSWPDYG